MNDALLRAMGLALMAIAIIFAGWLVSHRIPAVP